jgi:hypothetical protein
MEQFAWLFFSACLINNFTLAYFLGLCAFFGVMNRIETAFRLGLANIFVMGITSLSAWALNPDYSRDFVAKARFPKRIADAPGAAQRGALAVRRSEQRGRKTRGARKASLQQKES